MKLLIILFPRRIEHERVLVGSCYRYNFRNINSCFYESALVKTLWRGIHKLNEECGELTQALGKLGQYPTTVHPDGKGNLQERVTDEIADVMAASIFFAEQNGLDQDYIAKRAQMKLDLFRSWDMQGIKVDD